MYDFVLEHQGRKNFRLFLFSWHTLTITDFDAVSVDTDFLWWRISVLFDVQHYGLRGRPNTLISLIRFVKEFHPTFFPQSILSLKSSPFLLCHTVTVKKQFLVYSWSHCFDRPITVYESRVETSTCLWNLLRLHNSVLIKNFNVTFIWT